MKAKRKKKNIQLTLNRDEATLLRALLSAVSASIGEHQDFIDGMREALKASGQPKTSRWEPETLPARRSIKNGTKSVHFTT